MIGTLFNLVILAFAVYVIGSVGVDRYFGIDIATTRVEIPEVGEPRRVPVNP